MSTDTEFPATVPGTNTVIDRTTAWYSTDLKEKLQPAARELLENYSKIPPDEVESHVLAIRDIAWDIRPYPCIGQFRFLDLSMIQSPYYQTIISRLKTGNETFLDLGCCFGQEIRQLVYDGAPSSQLYGCDLLSDYFDCGYELFRDRDTLKATFFQADVFDPNSDLNQLDGKLDIVYMGSFLHLFGYSKQIEVCVRVTELLKDKEGVMVLGRQVGYDNPGETITARGNAVMGHDVETFRKMWEEVGRLTGTKWRVEGELLARARVSLGGPIPNGKFLRFAVFKEAVEGF